MNTEDPIAERQLSDMLRRVTPEPPRRVTVEDVAFRLANQAGQGRAGHRAPRARRGFPRWNRSWAPVLAAASVFAVAGTSAGITVGLTSHHGASSRPANQVTSTSAPPSPASSATPMQSPTSTEPTWPPESVAGGMWGAELINRSTFTQDSLASGANSLYAISPGYLDRIDPATGNVVAAAPYSAPVYGPPVVTGNTVWAMSSYSAGRVVLRGYEAKTLAQVASVTVPVSGQLSNSAQGVLTPGPDGNLYVAAGNRVAVVNPSSRQVIREIAVSAGLASSVAVSPDGSRLYVSTSSSQNDGLALRIYDLATGAQLSASGMSFGGGGNLVATSGGVWGTTGVGMSEWVWFAPGADLTRVVRVSQGAGGGLASVPVLSGGAVWIGGSHTLLCASPATGQVRTSVTIPTDGGVVEYFGTVTVTGGRTYAFYLNNRSQQAGLATLTPPSACSP